MNRAEFDELVRKAIRTLPKDFFEALSNVDVVTQDWPNPSQTEALRLRGEKGMLLGLYEGVPQTRRGRYGIGGALPDKITVFIFPQLRISRTLEELEENIRDTVLHEIGHHFGMSEEDIRKASKRDG